MYFLNILVLYCLTFQVLSKPAQVLEDYDKEAKEESYGDSYGPDSDDYLQNERKTFSKQDKKVLNGNDELENAQPGKDYLENSNDNQAESEHLPHNMFSSSNDVKRKAEFNRQNNIYLKNNEKQYKVQNNDFNTEETNLNPGHQNRYLRHPSRMRDADSNADETSDIKRIQYKQENLYRERRQINKKSDSNESLAAVEITTQTNEDEETAIKRHIKKLSKEELDDLLQSLSEDKRELLKNIIGSSQLNSEVLYKREITKKAGANEENNFVGNEQSDTSKVQGVSANIESESSISDKDNFEDTKTSVGETYSTKSAVIVNSSEKSTEKNAILDGTEDIKLTKLQECEENSPVAYTKNVAANSEQLPLKTENKREANDNSELANNDDLYCSETGDMSQLWNEESKLFERNEVNKREISPNNLDSMKSLEDSFPNSDDADNLKLGSNMAPLIRVKRTNLDKVVEKRDTNAISNLKVPYFSNTVEDNEEDNDEGSEFDDEGIFDRRSNIDKSGEISRRNIDSSTSNDYSFKSCGHNQPINKHNNNLKTDVSLGSDTDTVLSGMEGMDDNIMYNGMSRNRRTLSELNTEENINKQKNNPKLISESEDNEIVEQSNNAPRYQENDAFGSLPRNYEEDLGRFKRIRRLKILPSERDTNVGSKTLKGVD